MKNMIFLLVALLLVTACATTQPAPKSCDVVDGICLELTFDGESCTYDYEGPTDLGPGPGTIIFHNESDDWAATYMIRILGDKTLQDVILRVGEEPDAATSWGWYAPSWWFTIPGVGGELGAGESEFWEAVLEPGIHALFCVSHPPWPKQLGIWLGPSWTIEE